MRWTLLLFVLFAFGCEDDDPIAPDGSVPTAMMRGVYLNAADATPFGPATVELFDLDARAVVDRAVVDSTGSFSFVRIPPGNYLPVLVSDEVAPFGLPHARYTVVGDEHFEITIYVSETPTQLTDDGQGIAGRVVDATSGEAIPFARIEMSSPVAGPNWSQRDGVGSEWRGLTTRQEVAADSSGAFRIVPVPRFLFPVSQNPPIFETRIPSWRVVAPGYRSRSMESRVANGGAQTFTIALEAGVDDGEITGRVVGRDGRPRAGVTVVAEWRRGEGELLRRVVTGRDGVSADDGRFRTSGLPDGAYTLVAGIEGDDGWVDLSFLTGVDLEGSRDVGEIIVARAIEFADLPASAAPGDTLHWTPVDGAAGYRLTLRRGLDRAAVGLTTTEAAAVLDTSEQPFDVETVFRLELEAVDGEGRTLSRTDRPALIRWTPEPEL